MRFSGVVRRAVRMVKPCRDPTLGNTMGIGATAKYRRASGSNTKVLKVETVKNETPARQIRMAKRWFYETFPGENLYIYFISPHYLQWCFGPDTIRLRKTAELLLHKSAKTMLRKVNGSSLPSRLNLCGRMTHYEPRRKRTRQRTGHRTAHLNRDVFSSSV